MSASKKIVLLIVSALTYLGLVESVASTQDGKRPFTVADDIQLTVFAGTYGSDEELLSSPDGKYFVVETERGRLELNRPEGSLRFYRFQDIEDFLKRSNQSQAPSPIWVVNRATDQEGRVLKKWHWLPDSSGVAFLERIPVVIDSYRLVLADLRKKTIEPLTSAIDAVDQFDVRDRQHYVYTATDPADRQKRSADLKAPSMVGTGHSLSQLLLPDDPRTVQYYSNRTFYLWAFVHGKRFEVKQNGAPLVPEGALAMSPDGGSVVTSLPIPKVPRSWETLYPPPFSSDAYRIRAGESTARQYVQVNLVTGSVRSLTDAPVSNGTGGWAWSFSAPSWSRDGQAVLLPGTFLKSKQNLPSRPCIAVVYLPSNESTCVEMLKGRTEAGFEESFHHIQEARFISGDKHRVLVRFHNHPNLYALGKTEYNVAADGTWRVVKENQYDVDTNNDLDIFVKAGLNDPPKVIARYKQTSRIIWDPNPQLKNVELDQATVYTWMDKEGRKWRGALFKPHNYQRGQRYPLVIQTHGFTESKFIPSGVFPTAFAARALAATGIVVLQVPESEVCPIVTAGEGPCVVNGYEAAVNQLVSEGMVDAQRIGIIGFSRTCFYVMATLTTGSLHLKAASVTDGFLVGYWQYLLDIGPNEANSMIGAPPFGAGLQQWLRNSPEFNLDKVNAPLLVVAAGPNGVLQMWEPYAGLHYLQRPVDLIVLNTDEHVLTNPAVRMASQGGSVDWFRFWLQDYEDPDPAKAEQYKRWRELRKLQSENDKKRAAEAETGMKRN